MDAVLVYRDHVFLDDNAFAELVVWKVPHPVPGSQHSFKYRLAYVRDGVCQLRYDNEAGKGDHKHFGAREVGYEFKSVRKLLADFWSDVSDAG